MLSYERFCLFCDQPAASLSLYCVPCGEEQKSVRTGDNQTDDFIDDQYHEFVAPSRGWGHRSEKAFIPVEFGDEDGKWIQFTPDDPNQLSGPGRYEYEAGWVDVTFPNDRYVDKFAVTLEQMREDGAV